MNTIVVGDYVRYKIEKGTYTKGYAITYSNDVFRVMTIARNRAVLNNNKEYKLENLMKVPEGSGSVNTGAIERSEKAAKRKRLLKKAGFDS